MTCRLRILAVIFAAFAGSLVRASDLSDVLRRAGEFVARYAEGSAVILADESCQQRVFQSTVATSPPMAGTMVVETVGRRRWKAELALVPLPGASRPGSPWMEIRDVIEVDGAALPDRAARLEQMIRSDPNWKTTRAREIVEDSARFNIGPVRRTTNTPAVPLLVLHPPNQGRFAFNKIGEDEVGGVAAWKIAFAETRRPTLIRAGDDGSDLPVVRTLLIVPDTGEVLRAELMYGKLAENRLAVTYRLHPTFGLRLPSEMVEKLTVDEGRCWVEGKYIYSNFRRFETRARILDPGVR
jgi:hypothetical protein